MARAESDRTHHAQQCRDELNAEPSAVLAELPPESVLAGEGLQAAEEEVRQLKTRIENLGPVNMMALEELQEAEERLTFLDTQRQDLLASIEDTSAGHPRNRPGLAPAIPGSLQGHQRLFRGNFPQPCLAAESAKCG